MSFIQNNKMALLLAVVLGVFLLFAYKTDFSFVKLVQNSMPGPQLASPQPPPPDPKYAPSNSPPKTEADWRLEYEKERAK